MSEAIEIEVKKPSSYQTKKVTEKPVYSESQLKAFTSSMLSKGYMCSWLGMGGQKSKELAVVEVFKRVG